jgi:hypothetical protein
MVGKALIFLFIPFKLLFLVSLLSAVDLLVLALQVELTLDEEKRGAVKYILAVNRVKKAFAKGEIMDGIQDIGFPASVIPR